MNDQLDQPAHTCAICQRRPYERAQVCNPCRRWLVADLGQLVGLATLLPAAIAPTSGTENGLPIRIDVVDLTLTNTSDQPVLDHHGDQTGHPSIAAVLDSWVKDWIDTRGAGERLPIRTVPVLASWLIARLPDECDQHPAIADFAREIRHLLAVVRKVLNLATPQAVRYGVACPRCGTQALRRMVGAEWIECGDCGRLWDEEGYADLVRDAVPSRTLLSAAQVATMNGWTRDAVYKRVSRGTLRPDIGPWGGMHFWKADIMAS